LSVADAGADVLRDAPDATDHRRTPSVTTALTPVTTATTMTLKTGGTTSSDTRRGEVKIKAKG